MALPAYSPFGCLHMGERRMKRLSRVVLWLAVSMFSVYCGFVPGHALAANFSWANPTGGNWSNTADWTSDMPSAPAIQVPATRSISPAR